MDNFFFIWHLLVPFGLVSLGNHKRLRTSVDLLTTRRSQHNQNRMKNKNYIYFPNMQNFGILAPFKPFYKCYIFYFQTYIRWPSQKPNRVAVMINRWYIICKTHLRLNAAKYFPQMSWNLNSCFILIKHMT